MCPSLYLAAIVLLASSSSQTRSANFITTEWFAGVDDSPKKTYVSMKWRIAIAATSMTTQSSKRSGK